MFQLQRVLFDASNNAPIKNNERFTFPLKIYCDCFLETNQAFAKQKRNQMKDIKSKITFIQKSLSQFESYGNTKIPLHQILELTSSFL